MCTRECDSGMYMGWGTTDDGEKPEGYSDSCSVFVVNVVAKRIDDKRDVYHQIS